MRLVLELLLSLLLINAIVLDKARGVLSFKELKRRARAGRDKKAHAIYKMAAFGKSVPVYLWLTGTVSAALLYVMAVPHTWLASLVYLAVLAWLVRVWWPRSTKSWAWSWAAWFAPIFAWKLTYLSPLINKFSRPNLKSHQEGRLYEKEDLLEFLKEQVAQPDNRIEESELKIAAGALTFGDKKVAQIMTPLRKVHMVREDELIGPMLMDELHKTGFSRFPVVKNGTGNSANPDIVGTLFLKDIILHEGGQVRDLMHKKTFFINEVQSLREALSAFLKTHTHLFIVVNNFEEIVGVLSIEDVLEQILGEKIIDEFDRYDDLRAVAGLEAKREQATHQHVKAAKETLSQTEETVVE
jgi:CBS domain containing-hemolysin-like protein